MFSSDGTLQNLMSVKCLCLVGLKIKSMYEIKDVWFLPPLTMALRENQAGWQANWEKEKSWSIIRAPAIYFSMNEYYHGLAIVEDFSFYEIWPTEDGFAIRSSCSIKNFAINPRASKRKKLIQGCFFAYNNNNNKNQILNTRKENGSTRSWQV